MRGSTTFTGSCHVQGSHTALVLLQHGYKVTAIDNLDNAFEEVYKRLQKLAEDKAVHLAFIKVRGNLTLQSLRLKEGKLSS